MGIPENVQEAILEISETGEDFESLEESIRNALRLLLNNLSDVIVYILQPLPAAAAAAASTCYTSDPAANSKQQQLQQREGPWQGKHQQLPQQEEERQQLLQQHYVQEGQQRLVEAAADRRGSRTWELISCHSLLHTLPKEGIIWEVVCRGARVCVEGVEPSDPLSGLLPSANEPLKTLRKEVPSEGNKQTITLAIPASFIFVVCSPVIDTQLNSLVCVYAVVCDRLTVDDHQHLSFLEKQLVISYRRLKKQLSHSKLTTAAAASPVSSSSHTAAAAASPVSHSSHTAAAAASPGSHSSHTAAAAANPVPPSSYTAASSHVAAMPSVRSCTCPSCGALISCTCFQINHFINNHFLVTHSSEGAMLESSQSISSETHLISGGDRTHLISGGNKTHLLSGVDGTHLISDESVSLNNDQDIIFKSELCGTPNLNSSQIHVSLSSSPVRKNSHPMGFPERTLVPAPDCPIHSNTESSGPPVGKFLAHSPRQPARSDHLGHHAVITQSNSCPPSVPQFSIDLDIGGCEDIMDGGGGERDSLGTGVRLGVRGDCRRVSTTSFITSKDESVLTLCADLYDPDAASLQLKVLKYLVRRTHSESGFLLLIDTELQELFCQVIGGTVLHEEIRFPINRRGFSAVISSKKSLSLEQIDQEEFRSLKEYLPREINSFICIPVINRVTNDVMAIACLVNRIGCNRFTEEDERSVEHCFTYTAAVLHSTIAVQNERRLKTQTQVLLQVATNLFSHLEDLTTLLGEVMQEARNLTKAERCSVFLLDKEHNELIAKVFDGDASGELRLPADQGIAGHVATTGELLNIEDTYAHPLFYRGIDEATGFRTRNILCFPIKDEQGEVIGVAQLCNKINGVRFSKFDENIAKAFSVFCCVSIVHSLMYKKVRDIQHRNKLSNELMIYHMKVAMEEVHSLADAQIPVIDVIDCDLNKFSFIPRTIPTDSTITAVLSMMDDLGFLKQHRIRSSSISQFLLMVRKGYRDPPYHNWMHAFAVVHFCYLLYKNTNVLQYIEVYLLLISGLPDKGRFLPGRNLLEIEALALFVACLCHDIDHRGTTNSFQVASGSVLAALYSSEGSVLERHHFAQTMCILNTEGCNIFESLSKENYMRVLDLMRDIILATDLAQHLRKLKKIEKMADDGYEKTRTDHRSLLLGLLMTACDLSDQTKNFHNSTTIAERIYTEFFSQGDLERSIGRDPMEMMDRDKAVIPDLQVVFLDTIALPVYRVLYKLLPDTGEVLEAVENNKKKWLETNTRLLELNLPRDMNMFSHLNLLINNE